MWPFNRKEKEEKEPKASDWADAGPLLTEDGGEEHIFPLCPSRNSMSDG